MDPHRRAELRSLAYHQAISARLAADPSILERARARVADWERTNEVHPHYRTVWARWLALPIDELAAALSADTEAMTAARQVSPFAGALSPRERWALWRSVEP